MKKPTQQNFTRPFNEKFVLFDSKSYSKEAKKYIEFLEKEIKFSIPDLKKVSESIGAGHPLYGMLNGIIYKLNELVKK